MSMNLTAAYITLGCKVNQYETEQIRAGLESLGFKTLHSTEPADLYVINTCSVTNTADSKSRAAVRKAIRTNPDAVVIVTGCYSQLEPGEISGIEGVGIIVPNDQKDSIPDIMRARFGLNEKAEKDIQKSPKRMRTRAVVKVQDGCDNYCSYCVIPYARSTMTSRPLSSVVDEVKSLVDSGFREIVLTGIRLGSYRWQDFGVGDLVHACAEVEGIGRVRMSSIEPWEVSADLLDAMQSDKVCRHLHIPLQSGDDTILKRMNRRYNTSEYMQILDRVRNAVPGIGITTDVIVGFPGEDDNAFEHCLQTVKSAEFSRLHIFRYSPRKRTSASLMPDQIPENIKQERSALLDKLGMELKIAFARSWIMKTLPVLLETQPKCDDRLGGYADNYIEVRVKAGAGLKNHIVNVCAESVDETGIVSGHIANGDDCETFAAR